MDQLTYVIGYARVSTPKQAQTGESLEAQENAIRRYCEKKGYTLFPDNKVFKEPYSGSNLFRPAYKEILEIIKNNLHSKTKVKYLVFWDFDRLTRGGSADYDQIWKDVSEYGVELRDTTEIIQDEVDMMEEFGFDFSYNWAKGRPSEEAEKTKAEDARKQKKKIIQTLIIPEIRLTIDGYHTGSPDFGFQNQRRKKFV
jgi:DNA invertase Pin-like site-specific DNA recombinase